MRLQPTRWILGAALLLAAFAPARASAIPPPQTTPQNGALQGIHCEGNPTDFTVSSLEVTLRTSRTRFVAELTYTLRPGEDSAATELVLAPRIVGAFTAGWIGGAMHRGPLRVTLTPGAARTVKLRIEGVPASPRDPVQFVIPAIRARHPWLGPDLAQDEATQLTLDASLCGHRALPVRVTVYHDADTEASLQSRDPGSATSSFGTLENRTVFTATSTLVNVYLQPRGRALPAISFGGPVLGVGLLTDHQNARLHAGLEAGLGTSFVAALTLDTTFDRTWLVAPTIELTLPQILILPSAAIGAGVPLRFENGRTVRPGARLQLAVNWWALGFSMAVDFYAPTAYAGTHVEPVFYLTAGL